ncbi:MAG: saccharopine dehydrogenase NADP-binding domain-containing protein [Gemmatimonadota bacterium]
MNVLVLGCGEMAHVAIRDLFIHGSFDVLGVGSRTPENTESVFASLNYMNTDLAAHRVDVQEHAALVRLMRDYDVVCNLAGPNYRNAVPVARAAIEARVPLVDAMDDWETALQMFELDDAARAAGITIITGLGASPGITNVMARAGVDRLDRADEIHTAWIMRGSDPGGPALARHLLYSLPHRAFVYEDGQMNEVRPFQDGAEVVWFPYHGDVEVFHIGHPEPFMLARTFPDVRYADDKATFLPAEVNDLIVDLGKSVRLPGNGEDVDEMERAADQLHQTCKAMVSVPRIGALRAEVRGEVDGKRARWIFASPGRIGLGTGMPAAIGAKLLATGEVYQPGVHPPEACIDPDYLLDAIEIRGIDTVTQTFIEE